MENPWPAASPAAAPSMTPRTNHDRRGVQRARCASQPTSGRFSQLRAGTTSSARRRPPPVVPPRSTDPCGYSPEDDVACGRRTIGPTVTVNIKHGARCVPLHAVLSFHLSSANDAPRLRSAMETTVETIIAWTRRDRRRQHSAVSVDRSFRSRDSSITTACRRCRRWPGTTRPLVPSISRRPFVPIDRLSPCEAKSYWCERDHDEVAARQLFRARTAAPVNVAVRIRRQSRACRPSWFAQLDVRRRIDFADDCRADLDRSSATASISRPVRPADPGPLS